MTAQVGIIHSSPSTRTTTTVLQRCEKCRQPILLRRGQVLQPRGLNGMTHSEGHLVMLGRCPACDGKWSISDPGGLLSN